MNANTIQPSEARFAELAQAASAQGKTPEELADEAIAMLVRKRRLDELIDFGRRHAGKLGVREDDVERLIAEVRAERRR
jgi:hypothetical protein